MVSSLYFRILRSLRDRYKLKFAIKNNDFKSISLVNIEGQQVSDIVSEALLSNKPFLLSRFGSEEIKWFVHYKLLSKSYFLRVYAYITCRTETWEKSSRIIDNMTFQPKSLEMTKAFISQMNIAIREIDLLGSWLILEQSQEIKKYFEVHFCS